MLISVIVPIYKVEPHIVRCLDSLAKQTASPETYEVILVNDATPDNSAVLAEEYCTKYTHFKLVHHTENRGLGAARNTGIRASKGDFLLFVDSDDFIRRDALEVFMKTLGESSCDAVFAAYDMMTSAGEITRRIYRRPIQKEGNRKTYLFGRLGYSACGVLFKASIQRTHDLWFKEGVLHEDILFAYRFVCACNNIAGIADSLYYYIRHTSSIVGTFKERNLVDYLDAWADVKSTDKAWTAELEDAWRRKLDYMVDLLCTRALAATQPAQAKSWFAKYLAGRSEFSDIAQHILDIVDNKCDMAEASGVALTQERLAQLLYGKVVFCVQSAGEFDSCAALADEVERLGIESVVLYFSDDQSLYAVQNQFRHKAQVCHVPLNVRHHLPLSVLCYIFPGSFELSETTLYALHREQVPVLCLENQAGGDAPSKHRGLFDIVLDGAKADISARHLGQVAKTEIAAFRLRIANMVCRYPGNDCSFLDMSSYCALMAVSEAKTSASAQAKPESFTAKCRRAAISLVKNPSTAPHLARKIMMRIKNGLK